ncbi:MAG: C-GCAxxG-C-C family protein [Lentimicrobiaceae bacterium]|jgi:C_GCAxxG_C_C family probable redox protein
MDHSEKALSLFDNNFNCAQSVLTSFAEELGLTEDELLRVSSAFGGGIGRQQFTCGAVTGAAMALGLKFGKGKNDSDDKKQLTYDKTIELFDEFTRLNGSTICRKLLNDLDMRDEKQHAEIEAQNLFHTNCRKYVVDAVKITEQIISNS